MVVLYDNLRHFISLWAVLYDILHHSMMHVHIILFWPLFVICIIIDKGIFFFKKYRTQEQRTIN